MKILTNGRVPHAPEPVTWPLEPDVVVACRWCATRYRLESREEYRVMGEMDDAVSNCPVCKGWNATFRVDGPDGKVYGSRRTGFGLGGKP